METIRHYTAFIEYIEGFQKATIRNYKEKLNSMMNRFLEEWGECNRKLEKKQKKIGLDPESSLLLFRIWEYYSELAWIVFGLVSGAYHQSIREMRFILESCIAARYIDLKYPLSSLNEKIRKPELELHGKKLFDLVFKNLIIKSDINKLYTQLNKYIHASPDELKRIESEVQPFVASQIFFNPDTFDLSIDLLENLHSTLMKIAF